MLILMYVAVSPCVKFNAAAASVLTVRVVFGPDKTAFFTKNTNVTEYTRQHL